MSETAFESIQDRVTAADDTHAMLQQLVAENQEMKRQLAEVAPKPEPALSVSMGGEPVKHHLHLDDGTVIQNHEGIGTHYSDSTGVRRIVNYYPAVQVDPTMKYA